MTTGKSRFWTWCLAGLLVICAAAALNLAVSGLPWKVDLTEDGRYTLPPAAERIASGLEDLCKITVYLSEELPGPVRYLPRALTSRLEEFRAASGGKIEYEFIDPTQNEPLKEELKKRQPPLEGITLGDISEGKQIQGSYWFWMIFRYGDQEATFNLLELREALRSEGEFLRQIPFQIAAKLVKLRNPNVKIGIASDKKPPPPEMQQQAGREPIDSLGVLREAIKRHLPAPEDVALKSGTPIREDLNTIVVHRPEGLDERTVFELDQFLMKGKSVVLLLDNFSSLDLDRQMDWGPAMQGQSTSVKVRMTPHGLTDWLAHFGIVAGEGVVEDVACANQIFNRQEIVRDPNGRAYLTFRQVPAPLPGLILAKEFGDDKAPTGQFADQSPAFSGLGVVGMAWPVPLSIDRAAFEKHGSGAALEEVLKTSPEAVVRDITDQKIELRYDNGAPEAKAGTRGSRPLIVGVRGKLKSFFAGKTFGTSDRPPRKGPDGAELPEMPELPAKLEESREPGQLWVFADSDFPSNLLPQLIQRLNSIDAVNGLARMQVGLVNLLDTVLLGTDLVEIRRPNLKDRLVNVVRVDQDKSAIRRRTVLYPVLAILGVGLLWWIFRAIRTRVSSPTIALLETKP